MPFVATCRKCGLMMQAPDHAVGKKVRCKKCQSPVLLQPPGAPAQSQDSFAFSEAGPATRYGRRRQKAGIGWGVWLYLFVVLLGGGGASGFVIWQDRQQAKNSDNLFGDPDKLAAEMKKKFTNEFPEIKIPKVEPPKVDPPKTDPPKNDPPKVDPPKVDPPKVDPPKVDSPKVDPPKVDPPKVDPPKIDPPKGVGVAVKTADGAMTFTANENGRDLRFAKMSPDLKTLYTISSGENLLRVFEFGTWKQIDTIPLSHPDKEKNGRWSAALSPDGKTLAFTFWDRMQTLDLESKKAHVFDDQPDIGGNLLAPVFLDGDSFVAYCGQALFRQPKHLALYKWSVKDKKYVGGLESLSSDTLKRLNQNQNQGFGLSPNKNLLAYGKTGDESVWFADLATAKETEVWVHADKHRFVRQQGLEPTAGNFLFSPSGKLLLFGIGVGKGYGGTRLFLFDTEMNKLLHTWNSDQFYKSGFSDGYRGATISPDEKSLVFLGDRGKFVGIDVESGKPRGSFTAQATAGGSEVGAIEFSKDGKQFLATVGATIKVWNLDSLAWEPIPPPIPFFASTKTPDGAVTFRGNPAEQGVRILHLGPDDKTLFTMGGIENFIRVWDIGAGQPKDDILLPKSGGFFDQRRDFRVSPDGKHVLFTSGDRKFHVVNVEDGTTNDFAEAPGDVRVAGTVFLGDGKDFVVRSGRPIGDGAGFDVFDFSQRKAKGIVPNGGIKSLALEFAVSPAKRLVAYGTFGSHPISILELDTGNTYVAWDDPVKSKAVHPFGRPVVFSPKGNLMAFGAFAQAKGAARKLVVVDVEKKMVVKEWDLLRGKKNYMEQVITISPDEKLLVMADRDQQLHGFDLAAGNYLGAVEFKGSSQSNHGCGGLMFTSDGTKLIAGASDTIKIWDVAAIPFKE